MRIRGLFVVFVVYWVIGSMSVFKRWVVQVVTEGVSPREVEVGVRVRRDLHQQLVLPAPATPVVPRDEEDQLVQ